MYKNEEMTTGNAALDFAIAMGLKRPAAQTETANAMSFASAMGLKTAGKEERHNDDNNGAFGLRVRFA
ncbi:MAG: hypothetical protein IJL66_05995 [Lachnospiraceae bacterium]|nr:hypothetical protein [Lachnospiraceae bacterium]